MTPTRIAHLHGRDVFRGIPVPPSRRSSVGFGANREITSPMSLLLIDMPIDGFIEIETEEERAQFAGRFSRLRRYGQWVIRQRNDAPGWRLWRVE